MTAEQIIAECQRLCGWSCSPALSGFGVVVHEVDVPKPTLPQVRPLVRAFRALPGNIVGGELHCVLDDHNYERRHIRSCIASASQPVARWLGEVLLRLSNSQRRRMGYCGLAR